MDNTNSIDIFNNKDQFEHAQRVAIALSKSTMVPASYQGDKNVPNVIVALEMAKRIGMSPFMVMQNLHVIQGRPSWSSTFLIAAINTCGRFEPLRFKLEGNVNDRTCIAYTKDKSGNVLESPIVSMEMARAEGWVQKNGSKWKTMPDVMIRYRAASFFSRLHCPEISMGMQTIEEVVDLGIVNETQNLGEIDLSKLTDLPDIEIAETVDKETGEIISKEPEIESASIVKEEEIEKELFQEELTPDMPEYYTSAFKKTKTKAEAAKYIKENRAAIEGKFSAKIQGDIIKEFDKHEQSLKK